MTTQAPATTSDLKLPDIALSDLPEATKDFLISYSATGKTIPDVIREILDNAAANAGFSPAANPA